MKISELIPLIDENDYIQIWERKEDGKDILFFDGYTDEIEDDRDKDKYLTREVKKISNESYPVTNRIAPDIEEMGITRIIEIDI